MRKKRTYKKQRPSVVGYEEQPSAKRRRSSRILEVLIYITYVYDHLLPKSKDSPFFLEIKKCVRALK